MAADTTTEGPLVNPTELDSFKEVQETMARARTQADAIPGEITDRAMAGEAADALKALRFAREDAEKARKTEKQPYIDTGKRIDADFKELQSSVLAAESSLKDRLVLFEEAERKAAREEQKRLERNAAARQKREDEKAEAEGRRSRHVPAPAPPPPPPSGARGAHGKTVTREVTKYEIVDETQLPDEYLTREPDRKKIRAAVTAGLVVPGVRVWKEKEVATR